MSKDIGRDDVVFTYSLMDLLKPYTQCAREWWAKYEKATFTHTSTFPIKGGPPGMFEKCSRSPRQSCVYGIQAFPIVSASHLDLPKMVGGAMQMVEQICKKGLIIDEFTIISKVGLQSTLRAGLFLCYIPTEMLVTKPVARWVYMRPNEMLELINGIVSNTLVERLLPFVSEYKGDTV